MKTHTIAWWLVILGAVNWGLVGLLDYNLVDTVFGSSSLIGRVVYVLVGVAGAWLLYGQVAGKKK